MKKIIIIFLLAFAFNLHAESEMKKFMSKAERTRSVIMQKDALYKKASSTYSEVREKIKKKPPLSFRISLHLINGETSEPGKSRY